MATIISTATGQSAGPRLTRHARVRQQQRGLSDTEIDAALQWGRAVPLRGGVIAYHLGRRERAIAERSGTSIRDLRDLVVIVADGDIVLTAYPCDRIGRLRRARS